MFKNVLRPAIALIACSIACAVSAQAPHWAKIRIGVEGSYPPFSQISADGKLSGFDIDIANAICNQLKAQCTLVSQEFDGMMPALNARKFDMIVASMSITPERRKAADFSDSYYDIPSRWIARSGAFNFKDATAAALKGRKIIVTRNTPRAAYAQANFKDSEILLVAKEADVTMELAAGRGDIAFVSSLAASAAFLKSPEGKGFVQVGNPITLGGAKEGGGVGIAMRKGEDSLRTKVNEALRAIKADGTYRKINAQYFDFDISGD